MFHERILAEDWSVIDPAGRILTKPEVLKEAFTGERTITEGEIDQINVRDFGDWAVVTGRTQVIGTLAGAPTTPSAEAASTPPQAGGEPFEVTLRFTDVFSRASGEWQCVASQGTMLNE